MKHGHTIIDYIYSTSFCVLTVNVCVFVCVSPLELKLVRSVCECSSSSNSSSLCEMESAPIARPITGPDEQASAHPLSASLLIRKTESETGGVA